VFGKDHPGGRGRVSKFVGVEISHLSRVGHRTLDVSLALRLRGCHTAAVAGEFDDIRGRLEGIAEELADLAIDRLRESIDAGGQEFPVDERRLTRARRAIEKAVTLLNEPDDFDG
jgi:hypothetical protein